MNTNQDIAPDRISHNAPSPICGQCSTPILKDGDSPFQSPPETKFGSQSFPLYCQQCQLWYHIQCSRWSKLSGGKCPKCEKTLISANLFCDSCSAVVAIKADSKWPALTCNTCSNPTSLIAMTTAGGLECALLFGVAVATTALFVWTLVTHQSAIVRDISGILAVPFALPWLAMLLAGMLSSAVPGGGGADFQLTPQMRASQVPTFHASSFFRRLSRVYLTLVKSSLVALIVIVVIAGTFFGIAYFKIVFSNPQHH